MFSVTSPPPPAPSCSFAVGHQGRVMGTKTSIALKGLGSKAWDLEIPG